MTVSPFWLAGALLYAVIVGATVSAVLVSEWHWRRQRRIEVAIRVHREEAVNLGEHHRRLAPYTRPHGDRDGR